jgi:anti-sigma factor RsiW
VSCRFAHQDGAYVLGALSPAERQEYERHLGGCAECAQAVRELAGLPGLLSRVDPAVLESPPPPQPLPATLLPTLVDRVRRTRRRRAFITVGVSAAAVTAIAVGSLALTGSFDGESPRAKPSSSTSSAAPTSPVARAMQPVGPVAVRASVVFESVAWGTRLDLSCTYVGDGGDYEPAPGATYVLVVKTRDGRAEPVGTWRAQPGTTTRLSAATASGVDDISSVEVQTEQGKPVLRLTT